MVGRSGAGKSTLASVAGRLIDADEGEITLDGLAVGRLAPHALRDAIVYAFERPALFGETPFEAISFGAFEPSREQVLSATRDSRATAFLARLPRGMQTPLDETPMSGGERQRLEGWHAPAGRRTWEPRPLARPGRSDRHRRWVPENLGPGRQIDSQDNPKRRQPTRRSGRDPGAPDPTRTSPQDHASRAGSTIHTLPADSVRQRAAPTARVATPRSSNFGHVLPRPGGPWPRASAAGRGSALRRGQMASAGHQNGTRWASSPWRVDGSSRPERMRQNWTASRVWTWGVVAPPQVYVPPAGPVKLSVNA